MRINMQEWPLHPGRFSFISSICIQLELCTQKGIENKIYITMLPFLVISSYVSLISLHKRRLYVLLSTDWVGGKCGQKSPNQPKLLLDNYLPHPSPTLQDLDIFVDFRFGNLKSPLPFLPNTQNQSFSWRTLQRLWLYWKVTVLLKWCKNYSIFQIDANRPIISFDNHNIILYWTVFMLEYGFYRRRC